MKVINRYKRIYYSMPYGEDTRLPYETMKAGDEAILRKLIYLGSLDIFNNFNAIDTRSLEMICAFYELHWYKDVDSDKSHAFTSRYINGIKVLVKPGEEKYFDEIEMAARDFHVKCTLPTVIDKALEDFTALLTTSALECDCMRFVIKYLSSEHVAFEIRHERVYVEGLNACRHKLLEIVSHARQFKFTHTIVRFIGHQTRPVGVCCDNSKTGEQDYLIGLSSQDENKKAVFISLKGAYEELLLFDLDDNNKISYITLIRGSMMSLYNFVSNKSDGIFW